MSTRKCAFCGEESSSLKQCNACKTAWYCDTKCQKSHWTFHIFDCQPEKQIDTAYHLARAAHEDNIPVDCQTRMDFGFERAVLMLGREGMHRLSAFWREILVERRISPREVRNWRREGQMIERIKELYEPMTVAEKGELYPWFLQHQYLLDGTLVDEHIARKAAAQFSHTMIHSAWKFVGGAEHLSVDEIRARISKLPPHHQTCAELYQHLVSRIHPQQYMDLWLSYGFVAARDHDEATMIALSYMKLIECCTFAEFCTAFESSSIPALFERHGIIPSPLFCDVMAGSPVSYRSVWHLKHYVDQLVAAIPSTAFTPRPAPSVMFDYGYANCKKPSEASLLNCMYKELFKKINDGMNPLGLHLACISGVLFEFIKGFVKLSPNTAKFARLLQNPYSLPNEAGD